MVLALNQPLFAFVEGASYRRPVESETDGRLTYQYGPLQSQRVQITHDFDRPPGGVAHPTSTTTTNTEHRSLELTILHRGSAFSYAVGRE